LNILYETTQGYHHYLSLWLLASIFLNLFLLSPSQVSKYYVRLRWLYPLHIGILSMIIFTGLILIALKMFDMNHINIFMIIVTILLIYTQVKRHQYIKMLLEPITNELANGKKVLLKWFFIETFIITISFIFIKIFI